MLPIVFMKMGETKFLLIMFITVIIYRRKQQIFSALSLLFVQKAQIISFNSCLFNMEDSTQLSTQFKVMIRHSTELAQVSQYDYFQKKKPHLMAPKSVVEFLKIN